MAKFVAIFVCLVVLETGWALKCKMCKDAACSSLEDQTCPAPPSNSEVACLTHIYKESADSKQEILEKKCVNVLKDSKYACVTHSSKEVEVKCDTCTEDLCNEKSGASKISMGSIVIVSILTLIAPKFL